MTAPSEQPAIMGGEPVRPGGPPAWPIPDDDVYESLQAVYRDGSWGQYHGPRVPLLERRLAEYHGCAHAMLCSSGTFAVELALRALKVSAADEVILAGYDYGGNFNSVLAIGAKPVLVDIHRESWNMHVDLVAEAIGPSTKAIVASHLHGCVVPMRRLMEIARQHGVGVVEDAAQMPGAQIDGRKAGTWGDIGTLSFGGSKLLTAGRGGAIITASRELHHRAKLFSHRGNWVFPLSELQATVLLPQLEKLDTRNCQRAESMRQLVARLLPFPGLRPLANPIADTQPGYYKLGFQYDPDAFDGLSRDRFVAAMRAEGIALDAGFRSLHVNRSASRYRAGSRLAESERAHHGMVVLHHPVLLEPSDAIDEIALALAKIRRHSKHIG